MSITDYTTCTAIRAVLGVSEDEIDNSVILLPIYEVMLQEDLLDMSATLQTDYMAASVLVNPTAVDLRFIRIFQTYAAYQVAYTLLGSAQMFAPLDIKDGKAGVIRVADPFKPLEEMIIKSLSYIRIRLLAAYQAYNPAVLAPNAISRVMLTGAVLGVDPVTG